MSSHSESPPERYRIADLILDTGSRQVLRGRTQIRLPGLSFDLLLELARASPNALTVDELMDRVWRGAVVSPATVAKRVELLREALGDDSHDPRYVALVRGHGYRLVPRVRPADAEKIRRYWPLAVGIVLAAAVGAAWIWHNTRSADPVPEKSIAVLPFVSMSADPEDELFADGLSEELGHALANIPSLKVTGRTSSFYYKGRNEDLRSIGETLGVAHVLEGSVRRGGDKLRVTAQLIKTDDGFHLWSETYDRTVEDVLEIQDDIARNVVLTLRRALLDDEEEIISEHPKTDPETYALYLMALRLSRNTDTGSKARARVLFEQVVERDPDYVPAWNRLAAAEIGVLLAENETYPYSHDEGWRRIEEIIGRSLALNPGDAYAHTVLGTIAWLRDDDLVEAARYFQLALELNPTNLEVIHRTGDFAQFIGRLKDALALGEYVVAHDPLCLECRHSLARIYRYTGRLDEAEEAVRTLQSFRGQGWHWTLGVILLLKSDPQRAFESFERQDHHVYLRTQGQAMALHDLGRQAEFESKMTELLERWGHERPLEIAQVYAYINQPDAAFEWLEKAYHQNLGDLQYFFQDPLFDNLREDPRWRVLLERIGRSPEQLASIDFEVDFPRSD